MAGLSILDDNYRKMNLENVDLSRLDEISAEFKMDKYELLMTVVYFDLNMDEPEYNHIWNLRNNLVKNYKDFEEMRSITANLVEEIEYFPVAASSNGRKFINFVDSWFFERTYGGNRLHEGCDIMAEINEPGLYPVVSATDGVVEKMGWLEKGGYRVGVRSASGIYYYYAHLSEYGDIMVGDAVKAGDLLGFMGDTGYGEEGTRGMFDVHLHFGVYINDLAGNEVSVNPYWLIFLKKNKVLYFDY